MEENIFNDFAPESNREKENESEWKILVVDDNEAVHMATVFALRNYKYKEKGINLLRAYNNAGARGHLENNPDIAVVLLDVVMDESGLKLIPYIRKSEENKYAQIILRTGEPDEAPEREVVEKYEINDYIAKSEATQNKLFTSITSSLRSYENLRLIAQQQKQLVKYNEMLKEQNIVLEEKTKSQQEELEKVKSELISKELESKIGTRFIGCSKEIEKVRDSAMRLALFDECVLITGENGAGKEIVAQLVHHASNRKDKRFLAFNCTAISDHLVESVLFGYKKGSFTGAIKDNEGYFKSANNGTLFIDEIGEMNYDTQVKLLRAIEYNEIIPIGANNPEKIDVRIIAATNRDILQLVKDGKFREDLYYRINTSIINLPPLRERPVDIKPLFDYFLDSFVSKYKILKPEIDEKVYDYLWNYKFPGNVRELKNIVFNALINSDGNKVSVDILALPEAVDIDISDPEIVFTMESAISSAKRKAILKAQNQTKSGKADEICGILKISRANYYRYIKELGL